MIRNTKKLTLPENFAQNLLELEITYRLSEVPSKETVKSLLEFYTIGVEYYESIRSHKYLYFQQKMMEIFTSVNTMQAINQKKEQRHESPLRKKMKSELEEEKIEAYKIKQKHEKMLKEVVEGTSEKVTVGVVKKLMNENDLKAIETKEKVKRELQNQDEKLKEKLEKRKSRMFSKSFSGYTGENGTQDTLFTDISSESKEGTLSIIKPIEVSFDSIINENDSDNDDLELEKLNDVKQINLQKNQSSFT